MSLSPMPRMRIKNEQQFLKWSVIINTGNLVYMCAVVFLYFFLVKVIFNTHASKLRYAILPRYPVISKTGNE